jgi:hypothetical protein
MLKCLNVVDVALLAIALEGAKLKRGLIIKQSVSNCERKKRRRKKPLGQSSLINMFD